MKSKTYPWSWWSYIWFIIHIYSYNCPHQQSPPTKPTPADFLPCDDASSHGSSVQPAAVATAGLWAAGCGPTRGIRILLSGDQTIKPGSEDPIKIYIYIKIRSLIFIDILQMGKSHLYFPPHWLGRFYRSSTNGGCSSSATIATEYPGLHLTTGCAFLLAGSPNRKWDAFSSSIWAHIHIYIIDIVWATTSTYYMGCTSKCFQIKKLNLGKLQSCGPVVASWYDAITLLSQCEPAEWNVRDSSRRQGSGSHYWIT